jgi:hypothetical protein
VRRERLIFLLLPATIAATYVNSLGGPFQFDDYLVIVDRSSVHAFSGWLADRGIRPVRKLSYLLSWVSGLGSPGFHLANVAIHTANACLVYCLCRRLAASWLGPHRQAAATPVAAAAALVFALHPVQTEAVTYICGRSTSLMAMFYLASLLAYAKGREGGSAVWVYLLSPMLFGFALLTKEIAVTLPFALLLWETATHRMHEPRRAVFGRQWVHWTLLAAAVVALALHSGYGRLMAVSFRTRSWLENLANQAHAITYLFRQMVWPVQLSIDPDLPSSGVWTAGAVGKAAFLAALIAIGLVLVRRRSSLGFAVVWFFIQLAPTNSIVPRLDPVNDRQLYLAGIGFYLALTVGFCRLNAAWSMLRWTRLAAAATAVALVAMTALRNRDYRSEVALWESTVQSAPAKARPHHNLGCAYALAGRYDDAKRELEAALALRPDYPRARRNLAAIVAAR